jgi:hypothetical protein
MPGDVTAAAGDPGAIRAGRGGKRGEVFGQEAGIAVQSVNFADQIGAGGDVTVAARAYQHARIFARQQARRGARGAGYVVPGI